MKNLYALFILLFLVSGCETKKSAQWLFVVHSRDGEISRTELTLRDIDQYVLAFTDHPFRKSTLLPSREFVDRWPAIFDQQNPNATIAYVDSEGRYRGDAVELISPSLEGQTMRFTIKALDNVELEGRRTLGETAVFIEGSSYIPTKARLD